MNWHFVENRDTLRIRSSVWFTTRTRNLWEGLGGTQKCVCEGLTSLNWFFCGESWHTPSGVVCDLLRTRVTAVKNSEALKSASVRVLPHWTDIFVENRDTLRIRSSVWSSLHKSNCWEKLGGSQKCVCKGFISLTWYCAENRDTLRIRSSVWFITRTSNCRKQLGGSQERDCETLTSLNWPFCRESWHTLY